MADDDDDEYDEDADDVDDDDEGSEPEVTIEISGLSLFTHVGVTAAEREVGQRLLLDIRLDVGECDATITDRIEDTVDYAQVCEVANLVAQQRSYKTLERLCAAIADRLLDQYEAHAVWVKAAKPEPPLALPVTEVSVEVWRESRTEPAVRTVTAPAISGSAPTSATRRAHLAAAVAALRRARRRRCWPPRRCMRPSRSGWCSTSRTSSTPACGSRPSSVPRSCSTRARRSSARWAGPPAGPATARA